MKGQWIIHDNGASRILTVADGFFANRQRYWASRFPDRGLHEFRPWMSRKDLGDEVLQQAIVPPAGKPFPGLDHAHHHGSIYAKSAQLSSFQNGEESIRPCANLYDLIPGSYEEHKAAYDCLIQGPSWLSKLAQVLILEIMPIAKDEGPYNGLGGISDPALVGLVFIGKMTAPFASSKAVLALAHELGHQALMILQTIENMAGEHRDTLVYSGIREVKRPFLYSLHAAVALAYMLEAGKYLLDTQVTDAAERNYLLGLRAQQLHALKKGHAALAACNLPPICQQILMDLQNLSLAWELSDYGASY